jgi:hypothetical protein
MGSPSFFSHIEGFLRQVVLGRFAYQTGGLRGGLSRNADALDNGTQSARCSRSRACRGLLYLGSGIAAGLYQRLSPVSSLF